MSGLAFVNNYRDNDNLRSSFNGLTRQTYSFDFESWYRAGYWGGAYNPYSLADGDRIVANVSVNLMRLVIDGRDMNAIQLGTVMTDEAYRNRGLSRRLMEIILAEYEDKCDFIYLFANDSVLDFYPKFGFKRAAEYESSTVARKNGRQERRKLDMDLAEDRAILFRLIDHAIPSGKIGIRHDRGLVMFYCSTFYRECIFYLPVLDAAVVSQDMNGEVYIIDVFSEKNFDLDIIVSVFAAKGSRVSFGFTPEQSDSLTRKTDDNDTLFIRSRTPLELPKAQFPVLSKA